MNGFRSVRWVRTLNLLAQAVLVVTLCIGLNYVAFNHSLRWDLTQRGKFSLSPETKAYLQTLEQPVRIVVTLTENSDVPQVAAALPDVKGLLREYVYAAENNIDLPRRDGRISVEYLDVYAQNQKAAELGATDANVITFFCGDRTRIVTLDDLYQMDAARQLVAFQGEQVFTTAILDVAKSQKKVYFLSGHAEARVDDAQPNGLSALADALRRRNYSVGTIDIGASRGIPDDAALIIAVAPQQIEPIVQEQLRQYLSSTTQNGRLLLFLNPGMDAAGLGIRSLLEDWGIWVDNDLVVEADPASTTSSGHTLVRFLSEHPITDALRKLQNIAPHIGTSRSLRPDVVGARLSGLKVTTLAATSELAYGEIGYLNGPPVYTPGVDLRGLKGLDPSGRLGLIVASERTRPRIASDAAQVQALASAIDPNRSGKDAGKSDLFSVANGRLVVFGSADYATNQWFEAFQGNQLFVLNAVSWASGRDSWLNIPARPVERFQLSLSSQDLTRLRYSLLLVLPGAAALLGIFVYWTRRT